MCTQAGFLTVFPQYIPSLSGRLTKRRHIRHHDILPDQDGIDVSPEIFMNAIPESSPHRQIFRYPFQHRGIKYIQHFIIRFSPHILNKRAKFFKLRMVFACIGLCHRDIYGEYREYIQRIHGVEYEEILFYAPCIFLHFQETMLYRHCKTLPYPCRPLHFYESADPYQRRLSIRIGLCTCNSSARISSTSANTRTSDSYSWTQYSIPFSAAYTVAG